MLFVFSDFRFLISVLLAIYSAGVVLACMFKCVFVFLSLRIGLILSGLFAFSDHCCYWLSNPLFLISLRQFNQYAQHRRKIEDCKLKTKA